MKRGDRVYAAGFDFAGDVEIAALTVKSVGACVTVAERCWPLKYAARVAPERLSGSRLEALERLVATTAQEECAHVQALEEVRQRLAKVREMFAKAQKDGTP